MKNNKAKKHWLWLILCPPLIFLGVSLIVKLLWNCILPEVLGVKSINFWQAMGILLLSKILFGGINGGFGRKIRNAKMQHFRSQSEGMTDEEKEKFREVWKERCSSGFFRKS
ncbi:hypothetical protein ASG01_14185 [Chryseobacterium sp. Leaf180]|uniref:hypothetical protein n=1 Tax=Chryseobacterium sp. Leaf180 TaxID=1736289 RepID=UPI0006F745DF|nr:hypothetical protein [Chryseobacterium sp. Leaf180]KQR91539.1 hypothetical protein ASG01_14185 [Chryseobacterium sp. Leaf180]